MKISSLLAGFGICFGVVGTANAKIVTGTVQNYFSNLYATSLTGDVRTPEHDAACKSKYWYLVNTGYYTDFRINTTAGTNTVFMTYANEEMVLNGKLDTLSNKYVFTSNGLGESLQSLNAASITFSLDQEMWDSESQIVLHSPGYNSGEDTNVSDNACDCSCNCCEDHHSHPVKPQGFHCVLSTY